MDIDYMKLKRSRLDFDQLGAKYPTADGVNFHSEVMDGIPCYWVLPAGLQSRATIVVYLHGGCFVLGSLRSHGALVSHLAKALQKPILFIEYSLAPECPYPTAILEIVRVYEQLLFKYRGSTFAFAGDSAGAALSVAVISLLTRKKLSLPARQILISPWLDFLCSSDSIYTNSKIDRVLTKAQLEFYRDLYLFGRKPAQVNPIDLLHNNLPATLIMVGSLEILIDDSRKAFSEIQQYQPDVRLIVFEDQPHVWVLEDVASPAAREALRQIVTFLS